ncbi:transmembrane protein 62 isoform X2 [Pristis pectinata]|uniref:transmembrane protein 62 isoform X2 n=1 Tax=Pristis pectinata TaxID=685728 RepID=UPI00223E7A55|nr:transmembrane protein 62 isoform X2 [Pristis pectinata]
MLRLFSVLIAAGLFLACLTGYVLENYTVQQRTYGGAGEHLRGAQPPYPAGGMDNIFWFLQVSDIHISRFVDPQRAPDFQKFCTETIDVIKPEIVLVTGDLTDAKERNRIGSRQYEIEWQTYQTILKKSKVLEKTKWIDIKGNHDTFNIPSLESVNNYYSSAIAHLCGHLHTLGGFMPVLHSRHERGTLELELADWMDNRRYRVLVFDHDLFSFVDLKFDKWPVVVITNPKSALYSSPAHEPLGKIKHSTHIRVLAFSPAQVTSVLIKIDGVTMGSAVHIKGPLHTLPWRAKDYSTGMHYIEVRAQDKAGRTTIIGHKFTMEEVRLLPFDIMASFILRSSHYMTLRVIFILVLLANILVIIAFRYLTRPQLKESPGFFALVNFSFHVFSKTNILYYPVLLFTCYIAVGPWFIGEIVDGHFGACFVFGVVVDGHFLEGSLTFLIGILQLTFFNIPLICYLCWCLLLRCRGAYFRSHIKYTGWSCSVPMHISMLGLLGWQVYACYLLQKTYGTAAFFLSPVRTWSVILALVLVYKAWNLNNSAIRTFKADMKNCPYS